MSHNDKFLIATELEEIKSSLVLARNNFVEITEKYIDASDEQIKSVDNIIQKHLYDQQTKHFSQCEEEYTGAREWLKSLRKEKGFTQKMVAERLNVGRVNYTKIENGSTYSNLPIDIADQLAKIFGVSIQFILEQEKKMGFVSLRKNK